MKVVHEAVLKYCEWITTKPMRQDWFARRGKKADALNKKYEIWASKEMIVIGIFYE